MLLHTKLNFERNRSTLNQYGYHINDIGDLDDLLEAELVNSYLFASSSFIDSLEIFISDPSPLGRITVVKEMCIDLWKLK